MSLWLCVESDKFEKYAESNKSSFSIHKFCGPERCKEYEKDPEVNQEIKKIKRKVLPVSYILVGGVVDWQYNQIR